jgi:hypothetical protein
MCRKVRFLERIAVSFPGCALSATAFDGTTEWAALRASPSLVHVFANPHGPHVTHVLHFPEDVTFLEWGVVTKGSEARVFLLAVSVAQRVWLFEFPPLGAAKPGTPGPSEVPEPQLPGVWVESIGGMGPGKGEHASGGKSEPSGQDGVSVHWEALPVHVPKNPTGPSGIRTHDVDPAKGTWLVIPSCTGLDTPASGACLVSQVVWEYITSLPHPLPHVAPLTQPLPWPAPVLHDLGALASLLEADLDAEGFGPLVYIRRWLAQTPCQLSARCAIHLTPTPGPVALPHPGGPPTHNPGDGVLGGGALPAGGASSPIWQGCTSRVNAELPLVQALLAQGHLSCGDAGCLIFGDAQGKVWGVALGLLPLPTAPAAASKLSSSNAGNVGASGDTGQAWPRNAPSEGGNGASFGDPRPTDLSRDPGDEHRILLFNLEEPVVAILPVFGGDHGHAGALLIVGQQGRVLHVSARMGPRRGGLYGMTRRRLVISAGTDSGKQVRWSA